MHLGFNGNSPSWTTIAIPATGGWQNWTTVTLPVTLSAGTQIMTLLFDTGGLNCRYQRGEHKQRAASAIRHARLFRFADGPAG